MKTKISLLKFCIAAFSITLLSISSFAQTPKWKWAKKLFENDSTVASSVRDLNGNVYVTGVMSSATLTLGDTTFYNSTGSARKLFIAKYNAFGTLLWGRNIDGAGFNSRISKALIDANGNIYVSGGFNSGYLIFGNIAFPPNYNNQDDIFLAKYDAFGNVLWAKRAGGTGSDFGGVTSLDPNGNLYLTGGFYSSTISFGGTTLTNAGGMDAFIVKYDSLGTVLWAKREGSTAVYESFGPTSTDVYGNVYVSGGFESTVTFGNISITNTLAMSITIVKYDSTGTALWAKNYTGIGGSQGPSILGLNTDLTGNLYITINFFNSSFTAGTNILTNLDNTGSTSDICIVKYAPSGNILWAKSYGSNSNDSGGSLTDAFGNIYTTGIFSGSEMIFGNDTVIKVVVGNCTSGCYNIYIVKHDSLGNEIWALGAAGHSNFSNNRPSISIDPNGDLYVFGNFFWPSSTFGNTTLTTSLISPYMALVVDDVWPGDADNNGVVNNNDLLQIGLFYGHSGFARDNISNLWQADSSANWNITGNYGINIKHADCNGDSTIDANDTLAVNLNFNSTHAITATYNYNNERLTAPPIYFITSGNSYNAGDWVDVEVWLGNSTEPVNNLYGIAFNINYSSSLVLPGTESITYPVSWLGTPGTNAIKTAKIDPIANTAYGVITRIDHSNASGFGKIADFKFQVKTSIASTSAFHFSISDYMADNAAGVSQVFNTINDSVTIIAGINEINNLSGITISPNPFNHQTNITFNEEQKNITVKIMDVLGKEIKSLNFTGRQLIFKKEDMKEGVYFVEIIDVNKNVAIRKIIIQ